VRAKWFAVGNEATGFIAFGNIATGFIAVGNMARGFIAIGNLAVGVVAFGNVGFGILVGGGATVGVGLVAFSGVIALPVVEGFAATQVLTDVSPLFGAAPLLLWGLLSQVMKGQEPVPPDLPTLVDASGFASGAVTEGWVKGRVGAHDSAGEGLVRLVADGALLSVALAPAAAEVLPTLGRHEVLAHVATEDRLVAGPSGYREAPPTERVLVAQTLSAVPKAPVAWSDSRYIQWYISRAWRAGALVGTVAWLAHLVL
jgi:hypothetical protein